MSIRIRTLAEARETYRLNRRLCIGCCRNVSPVRGGTCCSLPHSERPFRHLTNAAGVPLGTYCLGFVTTDGEYVEVEI